MKKICLFLLLSCLCTVVFAARKSAISSVLVSNVYNYGDGKYEIFALKNTQGTTVTNTTAFSFVTTGNYTTSDIKAFYLYKSVSNSMTGAIFMGSVAATPAGPQTISYPAMEMPTDCTIFYMVFAEVTPDPVAGHTIAVDEIKNEENAPFTYQDIAPKFVTTTASGFKPMSFDTAGDLSFIPSNPYSHLSIGVGIGYSSIYGDLSESHPKPVFMVNISREINAKFSINMQVEDGWISSSSPACHWTTGLAETNHFMAMNLNGRYNFSSTIVDPQNVLTRLLSKLYCGAGLGIIDNHIINITDRFKESDAQTINNDIKTSSAPLTIPINTGLNFNLKNFFGLQGAKLNLNYQITYAFGDYVDGYSFSSKTTRNNFNDVYSILSAGFSVYIGHHKN